MSRAKIMVKGNSLNKKKMINERILRYKKEQMKRVKIWENTIHCHFLKS